MPSGDEASGRQSQIRATLESGIDQIAAKQEVTFRRYQRFALASDGSVFWVGTPETMNAIGSLHYATDREQNEDETIGANEVLFTSEEEITLLDVISPVTMWIGSWPITDAPPLRVAFSSRGNIFKQADVWHYSGFAVYPALQTQIIESAADLPAGPIVSNSLPIWLAQTTFADQTVPVYPSFLVPDNLIPPYIVAHIIPEGTQALGAFPIIGPWPGEAVPNSGASPLNELISQQLTRDEVTLTLYGFSNQMAIQYLNALIESSITPVEDIFGNLTPPFGFANSPTIMDAKRTQVEIATLAQKKMIHISANYYQGSAEAIARRLILAASISQLTVLGGPPARGVGSSAQRKQVVYAEGTVSQ